MSRSPDAILFDLDGVLVDTFEVWVGLLADVAVRLGYPAVDRSEVEKGWGQGIEADVRRFYPKHTKAQVREMYERHYADHLDSLTVMEGAGAALAAMAQPKAVITNSPVAIAEQALSIGKLAGHFETIVGSDSVQNSKPAPDMVVEACRRLGVRPVRALVIGDSRYDEEAAKAAGAPFVLFRSFAELRVP